MKQLSFFVFLFCYCSASPAQQVFFKSAQEFDKQHMTPFYSSIALRDSLLLFNSNDYQVYAYDKNNGQLRWKYYLSRKSDLPPFFVDSVIWAQSRSDEMIQLNRQTGQPTGLLALLTVETSPLIKGNIAYATGIYNGGCLFAYDIKADTVLWYRFLAHGCSVMPYYLADRIVANAEGNNWLEIGYDGRLLQTGCDTVEAGYPSELPCIKRFAFLTHDQKELPEDFIEKKFSTDRYELSFYTTAHHTFIAGNGRLLVLGDKRKEKINVQLSALSDSLYTDGETIKILQADEKTIWMLAGNNLVVYDHQHKQLASIIDLSSWHPHQVLMDGKKLWLISREDGLLYGLTF